MREIYGQDLTSINELEHRVLPVLIDMKMHGVRVDIDEAERAKQELLKKESGHLKKDKKRDWCGYQRLGSKVYI